MKKALALVLVLLFTVSGCALADGVWMRQLPQYVYTNAVLMSPESYPEVRLTTQSIYEFFNTYDPVTPTFLCFPGPENAYPENFDLDYVHYLDVDNHIQYSYQVFESNSFEEFLNKAESDDYILLDGEDDVAVRIAPEEFRVYGMIATREFGRSSKLIFQIKMDQLDSKMPADTIISSLSEIGLKEAGRIQAALRYETYPDMSAFNNYDGIKMLHTNDFDYLLKVAFPQFTVGNVTATPFVYKYMYDELEICYDLGEGRYAQVNYAIDDNPYPIYRMENDDPDAQEITLSDGSTWYIFMNGLSEYGKSTYVYASTPIGHQSYWGNDEFLTIHIDLEKLEWPNVEEFIADLENLYMGSFEAVSASSDPYVPSVVTPAASAQEPEPAVQEPAGEPQQAPAASENWVCPECGTENSGNFCTECGTARPVSNEWTCPECGRVNDGKF